MGTEGDAVASAQRVPLSVPARSTSRSEFDRFYDVALPEVYGYALHLCGGRDHDAWDLTQEAFVALVDQLRLGGTSTMSVGWLVSVVRTRFIDRWRRQERASRKLRLVAAGARADVDPEALSVRAVVEHIGACSPQHRAVLMMAYVDDLPVVSIAAALGLSVSRTYAVLDRARNELRAHLTGDTT